MFPVGEKWLRRVVEKLGMGIRAHGCITFYTTITTFTTITINHLNLLLLLLLPLRCEKSISEEIVLEMLAYLETADYSIGEGIVLKVGSPPSSLPPPSSSSASPPPPPGEVRYRLQVVRRRLTRDYVSEDSSEVSPLPPQPPNCSSLG